MRKFFTVLFFISLTSFAQVTVTDDLGRELVFEKIPQRVVVIAPHAMELVHAAGASDKIVGKGRYCDYPSELDGVPIVGDSLQVNMEILLTLNPDLLILWRYGVLSRQSDKVKQLGIPVFFSAPEKLRDIPDNIEKLGKIFNTEEKAEKSAREFRTRLSELKSRYANSETRTVFYQISERPRYTVNGEHMISEVIEICGGKNIFQNLPLIAPQVSLEAVLQADPDVIIHSGGEQRNINSIKEWQSFSMLKAVKKKNLYTIKSDLIDRPSPRIIEGAKTICEIIERSR